MRCDHVRCMAVILLFAFPGLGLAQDAGSRHVLLIGGLGGDPAYSETFGGYLSDVRSLLVDRYGVPAGQVTVLGERAVADRGFVDDVSTAENIRSAFARLADAASPGDHVYVLLFGHGSFDGSNAQLNIPRRDLSDADYAELLDGLRAGRVVFVNTASASGPFAQTLSAPDRIVIAATSTGTQRDETVFPRFLVEALRTPDADLDKGGGLSILEIFRYAAGETARSFEAAGHLATEHTVIDDDGDGSPTRFDRLDDAGSADGGTADGSLAAVTYLRPPAELAEVSASARPLLREREALQRSIAVLKSRKPEMDIEAYYGRLEDLLVELARLNDRIERTP